VKIPKQILAGFLLPAWSAVSPAASSGSIPQIITEPQNQITLVGSNATFSVSATGGSLTYQWYWNETNPVPWGTNASLTVTNVGVEEAGDFFVAVSNPDGAVNSIDAHLTVLTPLTGPANPFAPGTLGYDLFQGTYALASSTNRTGYFNPNLPNLGTNSAVWTWPVNLSCVGYASDGYESVLIARDKLLTCAHMGGEAGRTVMFRDTNGIPWVGVVTNTIDVIADLVIAQLSNAAPPSIVIPYVLPPEYTNYIAGNSLAGMPAFWLHKNPSHIDYAPVYFVTDANFFGYGTWMDLLQNGYGQFAGTSGTGGDSASPAFMSISNNPILLFATSLSSDSAGLFVSGMTNWHSLVTLGLTNGMRILDLSGYPLQSQSPPNNLVAPDYAVPPTNVSASTGAFVTFSAGIYVFGAPPFTYQWQLNGTNLAGATNATLTIQATPDNAGNYTVVVSNVLGLVTLGPASLQLEAAGTGDVPLLPNWGAPALMAGLLGIGAAYLNGRTSRASKLGVSAPPRLNITDD
jgi:hypothetical protein